MSEIEDKRYVMTDKKLEHLKNMRAKSAEKARLKKEQKLKEQEESAKLQILSEPLHESEPEPEEIIEPPTRTAKTPVTRTKTAPIYSSSQVSLTDDDLNIVRDFVTASKQQRKEKKWLERKNEILSEVFQSLIPQEDESEEENDNMNPKGQVQNTLGNLSLFD